MRVPLLLELISNTPASEDIPIETELADISNFAQQRLTELTTPITAAVAGYALSGGCEASLCCDYSEALYYSFAT